MNDSKTNSQLLTPNQQADQKAIKQNIAGLSDAQKQALSETLRQTLVRLSVAGSSGKAC